MARRHEVQHHVAMRIELCPRLGECQQFQFAAAGDFAGRIVNAQRETLIFKPSFDHVSRQPRLGTNCCVDVPRRVSAALGGAFRIAVRGTMGGTSFRSTLVPRGGGRHRLFVSARAWQSLGLSEGDPIAVRIERDPGTFSFVPELPDSAPTGLAPDYARSAGWVRPARCREDLQKVELGN
jgi:hypothetical protein